MTGEKDHFSLTWDKYHASICAGFSLLQQNGELVDLTLAADGHLVKVHQIVLGVASPYIKELIQSANCKHPVIFMNNISYADLRSILEYVYTGEASVAQENLKSFFSTAKSLKIKGLEFLQSVSKSNVNQTVNSQEIINFGEVMVGIGNKQINDEDKPTWTNVFQSNAVQQEIPAGFSWPKVFCAKEKPTEDQIKVIKDEQTSKIHSPTATRKRKSVFAQPEVEKKMNSSDDELHDTDTGQDLMGDDDFEENDPKQLKKIDVTVNAEEDKTVSTAVADLQYTVSNRGSLQLILNRFMYNLHYSRSKAKHLRMWRCVDYQDHRCVATAVTDNDVVVKRTNLHNHPFHDQRILKKIRKKAVYSAIRAVENNEVVTKS